MRTFEFWLAVAYNFRVVACALGGVAGILFVIALVIWWSNKNEAATSRRKSQEDGGSKFYERYAVQEEANAAHAASVMRKTWPVALLLVLGAVPSLHDMWEVRVDLLKLELASPENVQKGGEHLEMIVKGLECKYLGQNCPEKKEESK